MGTIENILSIQLERDVFHNEDTKVAGIARLAIDKGFNSLSVAQKAILNRHLTKDCSGHTDPGGSHNGCNKKLSGESLLNAYIQYDDPECLQCESCLSEVSHEQHVWNEYYTD